MKKSKLTKILNNLSNVQQIELRDSKTYKDFSVVVINQHYSEIIICESSKQANRLYNFLNEKLNEFQQQKENTITI